MNNTLIENIKIKSDLQYDFLFESNQYEQLDSDLKLFLKEIAHIYWLQYFPLDLHL